MIIYCYRVQYISTLYHTHKHKLACWLCMVVLYVLVVWSWTYTINNVMLSFVIMLQLCVLGSVQNASVSYFGHRHTGGSKPIFKKYAQNTSRICVYKVHVYGARI